MRNYNFYDTLSWNEFQSLACEVIAVREHLHLQTFSDGADGGVDGLWFDELQNIVVQVKRYKEFKTLYRQLKNSELPKVQRLRPNRYILVVSLSLTKSQADQIYQLFDGYIQESQDLLAQNELNTLLAQPEYRHIEKEYVKLWFTGWEMMKTLLQPASHNRNTNAYRNALNAGQTFVQTRTYNQALAKLEAHHSLLISGEPGMGKTTLAYLLALSFLEDDGPSGFIWADSLEDIDSQWEDGRKQAFILDDFWGSNFYQENKRKASRRLEDLILRLGQAPDKRLIITSREYIVQQETEKSPELKDVIGNLKLECLLKNYTRSEKARILFSHLKASDLEYEYAEAVYHFCDEIVSHPGYSPRVLEKFLKYENPREYSPYNYANALIGYLEYPEHFWEQIFSELSEEARMILLLLAVTQTPAPLEAIHHTYGKYIQDYAQSPKSFGSCIAELEKTLLSTYWDDDTQEIQLLFDNPSIIDFLLFYLQEHQDFYIPKLYKICDYYNQLLSLLQHITYHDEALRLLVENRCIQEFDSLPSEYWGEDFLFDHDLNQAGRAFQLIRAAKCSSGSPVWTFIHDYVLHFFEHSFNESMEMADYISLVELCEDMGMHFNAEDILRQYRTHSRLVNSYIHFSGWKVIYPDAYEKYSDEYMRFMKDNLKFLILETLTYFDEEDDDVQMDLLVDSIPDYLKEYGLRYTHKFKMQIQEIAGRYYEPSSPMPLAPYNDKPLDPDVEDYVKVKADGHDWLFGKGLDALGDAQIISQIRKMKLPSHIKSAWIRVMTTREPWYIYETLRTEDSLLIFQKVLEDLHSFPTHIDTFINLFLYYIAPDDENLKKLISFCAEYAVDLLYKDPPILTDKSLRTLPSYQHYLQENPALERCVFQHLLGKDDHWIHVRYEVVLLYCLCRILVSDDKMDWEFLTSPSTPFLLKVNHEPYYPDLKLGPAICYEWKRCILLLFREIDTERFYHQYVVPTLRKFLGSPQESENHLLWLLKELRLQLTVNDNYMILGEQMTVPDAVDLMDILGFTSISGIFSDILTQDNLQYLANRKGLCRKDGNRIRISVYQEKSITALKKGGIYQILNDYWEGCLRFLEKYDHDIQE